MKAEIKSQVKAVKVKKSYDKITLEEFWDETEKDPVKLSSLSKKLMTELSPEDKKRLNY